MLTKIEFKTLEKELKARTKADFIEWAKTNLVEKTSKAPDPKNYQEVFGNTRNISVTKMTPVSDTSAVNQAKKGVSIRTAGDGQLADELKSKSRR